MLFLEAKYVRDLGIAHQPFKLSNLAGERNVWKKCFASSRVGTQRHNGVVDSIEDLVPETVLLDTQVDDLP